VAFLARHLAPGACVYADFCAQRRSTALGAVMRRPIWPGPVAYVDLARLIRALQRGGFQVHEVGDDTLDYAWTVRDWARGLAAVRGELAARFGEPAVRAFLLFFWGAYHFLTHGHTQAYHVVAGRRPRGA
jgi:cyclopropane fatty-acyl-phospholipid synthase-like methyltransferase